MCSIQYCISDVSIDAKYLAQSVKSARLSLQSSEMGLTPPPSECAPPPPPMFPGGTHSLAGEGAGGANSDEGTDTLGIE